MSAEPDQFFPVGMGEGGSREAAAAKAVCRACPVIGECRDFSLSTRQPFGVWGGLDEEERRVLLATRQPVVAG